MTSTAERNPCANASNGSHPPMPSAWRCAISPDHRWALIYDEERRNIAEIHQPAVPTGPDDDTRRPSFEQVVLLMRAAPQLCALLQETIAPGGIGPHEFARPGGYRDRACSLLRSLALWPQQESARLLRPELLARLPAGEGFRFVSDPSAAVFVRCRGGYRSGSDGKVVSFHPDQLVYRLASPLPRD